MRIIVGSALLLAIVVPGIDTIFGLLGATTAVSLVGVACVFASMDKRYRSSFYKHCTLMMHNRSYVWKSKETLTLNGKLVKNRELVLTCAGLDQALCYWPMELVKPFVRENWCVVSGGLVVCAVA